MKVFKPIFISLALATIAAPRVGIAGAGVRGGELVFINGKYINRDFLEARKNCWVSGIQVEAENPGVGRVLESLSKVDWYFALVVEKRLHKLNFCFGGPLKPIEFDSRQNIRRAPRYPSFFVALQTTDGTVFEDEDLFKKISDPDLSDEDAKGMHLIHEAMHSFIAPDTDDATRRQEVFSTLSVIRDIHLKKVISRDVLYTNLSANNILFPLTGSYLDPFRAQIIFLLGDATQRDHIFFSTSGLDVTLSKSIRSVSNLVEDEDRFMMKLDPLEVLTSYVEEVLRFGSESQVSYVFNKAGLTLIDPNFLSLGIYENVTSEQQAKLFSQVSVKPEIDRAIAKIATAQARVKMDLLYANRELKSLSNQNAESSAQLVMALRPLAGGGSIPREIKSLAVAIAFLANKEDWAELGKEIGENPLFYGAMNFDQAKVSVGQAKSVVPREKDYALAALEALRGGLATTLQDYLRGVLTTACFEQVLKVIHWDRLGTVTKIDPENEN